MFKPNLMHALKLSLGLAIVLSFSSWAGEEDFDQPIKILSLKNSADGKRKILIYQENVQVTQGSLAINADLMEVNQNAGQGKEIFVAKGSPATFQQEQDNGTVFKAQAFEIQYERATRKLTLVGQAEIDQDGSKVSAESITYDMRQKQLLAHSSNDNGKDTPVVTIFQPDALSTLNNDKKEDEDNKEQQP